MWPVAFYIRSQISQCLSLRETSRFETGRKYRSVTFEILTAVKIPMMVFWAMMPCGPVGGYQRFGGTYCLHLQKVEKMCSSQTFVAYLQFYTMNHLKKQPSSFSQLPMFKPKQRPSNADVSRVLSQIYLSFTRRKFC
jgi:hypothetical protein